MQADDAGIRFTTVDEARGAFLQNLPLIYEVIRQVCGAARVPADERADFASVVMLKLIDNDYAVFRAFRGRSTLKTYLSVVVKRCLLDLRDKQWGRWRPSEVARRKGHAATLLERLVDREGLPMQQAVPALKRESMTSSSGAWRLYGELPARSHRPREVPLAPDLDVKGPEHADVRVVRDHMEREGRRVRRALVKAWASLSADDQHLLRLRFQDHLPIVRIAGLLKIDVTLLYRRLASVLVRLRARLREQQLTASDILPLVGNVGALDGAMTLSASHDGGMTSSSGRVQLGR